MRPTASPSRVRNALGVVAVAGMIGGPALAWLRLVPALVGFGIFGLGGLVAVVVGIASVVQTIRGRGLSAGGAAAAVAGAVFLVLASRGAGVPRINDFSTDLTDPPVFHHAATLPANAGRDLGYPGAFRAVQEACCSDLRPAHVAASPAEAFARARRVAESMPAWTITESDPAAGIIEAVATTRVFGFQDDIVIRVRGDGDSSRVDMRSKSRDGKGDMGTNAKRMRAFVAALEAEGDGTR